MSASWPPLSEAQDGETIAALHLSSQIIGKAAVAVIPWRNHSWHATLHLTARGLATEPLHLPTGTVLLGLDLIDHRLTIDDSAGSREAIDLRQTSVADLYRQIITSLSLAGHRIAIHGQPNEIEGAVQFAQDRQIRAYDPDSAARLLTVLRHADRLLRLFRSGFIGKASPVHFFWGSFDLAVTRFSGNRAPLHPGGIPNLPDEITREAYSHEVSSAGFWPGGAAGGRPLFYSYAYPEPPGFADGAVAPDAAHYDPTLREFVLDYQEVRSSSDPDAAVLGFLDSTYELAAGLGRWDRKALESPRGKPRVPRPLADATG
jgi:hypothetical protein